MGTVEVVLYYCPLVEELALQEPDGPQLDKKQEKKAGQIAETVQTDVSY